VRALPLFFVALAGCATTQTDETDVFLLEIVTKHCKVPDLETFFPFDSAQIDRSDHHDLNALAECLTEGPLSKSKVELIGHADPMGPETYNDELSLRRAKEVARYLARRGVPEDRMHVRAAGVDDDAPKPRLARRVDIKLIDCTIDPKQKCRD
jgi:outer membrane protein OmpA-like peptidoglycan-associated protein